MEEEAVLIGKNVSLVGIITQPSPARGNETFPAVIFLDAGLLHRVGPHRLYVKMARVLSAAGFLVLRFDFSGMGDSEVRRDHLPYEKSVVAEAREAMDFLHTTKGIQRFILAGLCSGAWAAFRTACVDPRVTGVVLIEAFHFKTIRYYWNRYWIHKYWRSLCSYASWGRLIRGQSYTGGMVKRGLISKLKGSKTQELQGPPRGKEPGGVSLLPSLRKGRGLQRPEIVAGLRVLKKRGAYVTFVYREGNEAIYNYRVKIESDEIRVLGQCGKSRAEFVRHSDHTFSSLASQERLLKVVYRCTQGMVQV